MFLNVFFFFFFIGQAGRVAPGYICIYMYICMYVCVYIYIVCTHT